MTNSRDAAGTATTGEHVDDDAGTGRAAPADPGRRHALALAAWAAGVAAAGAASARGVARTAGRPAPTVPVAAVRPSSAGGSAPPVGSPAAATVAEPSPPAVPASPGPVTAASDGSVAALAAPGAVLTGDELVAHVARRASFGPTPDLLDEIRAAGVDAWLEQQLQPAAIDDSDVDHELRVLHDLHRSPAELRSLGRQGHLVAADLRVAAVVRAVESRRHLQEVMVDLWHDHLVASGGTGRVGLFLPAFDRDVIRRHALGRFADLLKGATRSAAMLEYLDTTESRAPDVNENHGRELLELHTVSRAAGYTQDDVVGASRVLSGWTIESGGLTVVFDPDRHDDRPASVLGWSTPGRAGAAAAGELDSLLDHLAAHPATARHLATLLVTRFVADDPPPALVDSTAAAYLATGTDIAATLRHVFGSAELRSGGAPIVRRPLDLLAAHLRAADADLDVRGLVDRVLPVVGVKDPVVGPAIDQATGLLGPVAGPLVDDAATLVDGTADAALGGHVGQRPVTRSVDWVLYRNGQRIFAAPGPAGHALPGHRWGSADALLRRWSLGAWLVHGRLQGVSVDLAPLAGDAATAGALVDALAHRSFGGPASAATRAGALAVMELAEGDAIGAEPAERARHVRRALGFLLSAPEAQLR